MPKLYVPLLMLGLIAAGAPVGVKATWPMLVAGNAKPDKIERHPAAE